jgi:internalin A
MFEQGTAAILAYLQEHLESESKQWASKLLLVGEGGVGKTSLARALLEEPFNTEESSTSGIEITSLSFRHPCEDGIMMELSAWDFGGQEIYHATHQFFLSNRSLFLVVWNARYGFEQGKLYYWLDTIAALAPDSPIILVATFIDERDAVAPLSDLRRRYPQIIGCCEVSNKTGAGMEALRQEITDAAAKLPLMGETWPTSWFNAANDIRQRSKERNHITPVQLQEIMSEHSVKYSAVLSQHLHDLGDILYFRDDDELNDCVILSPEWVDQSISKVLQSEQVINSKGLFTIAQMNELWSDVDPSMRGHLLRLMERFDLSYRTLENKEISLVVERLSSDPPDYEALWNHLRNDASREISMKFQFATTIPAGIPTWFIARAHRFTTHTHWRYGALFADGPERKHLALIQAFPHERYIQLTARGPFPYDFFALLRDGLELTLSRFPGLEPKIERRVRCLGHGKEPCNYEFDVRHLTRAIDKRYPILELQCPLAFENVSVTKLLFGIYWSISNEVLRSHFDGLFDELISNDDERRLFSALKQREFLRTFYHDQAKLDTTCPNIFTLRPSEDARWHETSAGQRVYLQLYCQAPGEWHPAELGGLYTITHAADWLHAIAPYIKHLAAALKYTTPVAGPWIDEPDNYKQLLHHDIRLMEELGRSLPDPPFDKRRIFEEREIVETDQRFHGRLLFGGAVGKVRRLLDEKDPHQRWGGLRRIVTSEGHLLWLCPYHAESYFQ